MEPFRLKGTFMLRLLVLLTLMLHVPANLPAEVPTRGDLHQVGRGTMQDCRWSADGRYFITHDRHQIYIWNNWDGQLVMQLPGSYYGFDTTTTGSLLAACRTEGGIEIWDLETMTRQREIPSPPLGLLSISASGQTIAGSVYLQNSLIHQYDLRHSDVPTTFTVPVHLFIRQLALSPDGSLLVYRDYQKINVLDVNTLQPLWQSLDVTDFSWSPDSTFLVSGKFETPGIRYSLWNPQTGDLITSFKPLSMPSPFPKVAILDDDRISYSTDFGFEIYSLSLKRYVGRFFSEDRYSYDLAFKVTLNEPRFHAATEYLKLVQSWTSTESLPVRIYQPHESFISSTQFAKSSGVIYTGHTTSRFRLLNPDTGEELISGGQRLFHNFGEKRPGVYLDGHHLIVTATSDTTLRVNEALTGLPLRWLDASVGKIRFLAVTPDQQHLVCGGEMHTRIFNLPHFEIISVLPAAVLGDCLPDNLHVLLYGSRYAVYRMSDGGMVYQEPLSTFPNLTPFTLDVSPTGDHVVLSTLMSGFHAVASHRLYQPGILWQTKIRESRGQSGEAVTVTRFSPTGESVFIAMHVMDSAHLLDAYTGEVLVNYRTRNYVLSADFDPTGKVVYAGGARLVALDATIPRNAAAEWMLYQ